MYSELGDRYGRPILIEDLTASALTGGTTWLESARAFNELEIRSPSFPIGPEHGYHDLKPARHPKSLHDFRWWYGLTFPGGQHFRFNLSRTNGKQQEFHRHPAQDETLFIRPVGKEGQILLADRKIVLPADQTTCLVVPPGIPHNLAFGDKGIIFNPRTMAVLDRQVVPLENLQPHTEEKLRLAALDETPAVIVTASPAARWNYRFIKSGGRIPARAGHFYHLVAMPDDLSQCQVSVFAAERDTPLPLAINSLVCESQF